MKTNTLEKSTSKRTSFDSLQVIDKYGDAVTERLHSSGCICQLALHCKQTSDQILLQRSITYAYTQKCDIISTHMRFRSPRQSECWTRGPA